MFSFFEEVLKSSNFFEILSKIFEKISFFGTQFLPNLQKFLQRGWSSGDIRGGRAKKIFGFRSPMDVLKPHQLCLPLAFIFHIILGDQFN